MGSGRFARNGIRPGKVERRVFRNFAGGVCVRELAGGHRILDNFPAVGLAPKVFCRIQRFTQVFGAIEQPGSDWAATAAACGYYDQAHLIRDCKRLAGHTPAVLLAEDADLARHFYRRFAAPQCTRDAASSS